MNKHTASVFLTPTTRLPPFMAFPRFLLELNMGETPKLLYMLLLDRARLSMQNEGWVDSQGKVYVQCTVQHMSQALHRSNGTMQEALNVLTEQGLIYRHRRGIGNPNRIYVKIPVSEYADSGNKKQESTGSNTQKTNVLTSRKSDVITSENQRSDMQKTDVLTPYKSDVITSENRRSDMQKTHVLNSEKLYARTAENQRSDMQKTDVLITEKPYSSNNDINKTNRIKRESNMLHPLGSCKNVILSPQELTALKSDFTDWSMRIERLSTYMASSGKTYRNHAATIRHWAAQDKPAATPNTTKRNYHCEENESL